MVLVNGSNAPSNSTPEHTLQAKIDAIANTLAALAHEQGIRDQGEHLLTRFVGLEDAPEDEIDREQDRVRRIADRTAHRLARADDAGVESQDVRVTDGGDGRPAPDPVACHGPG